LTEYVWLDDMPLAVVANVDTSSPSLYFVHADHLNRPIRMTDGSESVVWNAVYNPFGDVYSITGSASNNMRFPGQYFLIEDGLHYNWYRHYDPTLGRYIQPDPLRDVMGTSLQGLHLAALTAGGAELREFTNGPSIYSYVRSSPAINFDPEGLQGTPPPPAQIPGGPWTWYPDEKNSRGGTWQDSAGNSGNWDDSGGHWDIWDCEGNRQRYNRHGAPISPDDAHGPYKGPPRIPFLRWPNIPLILTVDPCLLEPDMCMPGRT
jgi:RHS repeat-associated protein